jgi:formamidopyrimidine-DNA glycosylase
MIAGRLHWHKEPPKLSKRVIASFDFSTGSMSLTEAGSKKRASLHVVGSEMELAGLDPGGLDVMEADLSAFKSALVAQNHTLKRSLTDPHIFSGIGNAYSDEILHRARLSPILLTSKLTSGQIQTLFEAVRLTLNEWTARFIEEAHEAFPENVTAFRDGMAVHGRYGEPCPRCGTKVQRIRYADNETNYCPTCQTGGRLLADRALSRLLREDWPRTLDELESIRQP